MFLILFVLLVSCNGGKNLEFTRCQYKFKYWSEKALASYDSMMKAKNIMVYSNYDGSYNTLWDRYQLLDEVMKRIDIYSDSAKVYIKKYNLIVKDSSKMILPKEGSIFSLSVNKK